MNGRHACKRFQTGNSWPFRRDAAFTRQPGTRTALQGSRARPVVAARHLQHGGGVGWNLGVWYEFDNFTRLSYASSHRAQSALAHLRGRARARASSGVSCLQREGAAPVLGRVTRGKRTRQGARLSPGTAAGQGQAQSAARRPASSGRLADAGSGRARAELGACSSAVRPRRPRSSFSARAASARRRSCCASARRCSARGSRRRCRRRTWTSS